MKISSMYIIKVTLITLFIILVSACSNKELYESIQPKYNENECRKLPPHEYEKCINQKGKSYKEYTKERKEIIKNR